MKNLLSSSFAVKKAVDVKRFATIVMFSLFSLVATAMSAQTPASGGGVFQVGDRIAVRIEGPLAFSDTVVVREGVVIQIPNIGDISVQGVRRSDVQAHLSSEIAKFVKEPVVIAVALVRVAIVGSVARPGYYSVPSDMVLSDMLMLAGGPLATADVNKSVVKRGSSEVMDKKALSQAFAGGWTLDQMRLASGDQIVIGERGRGGMENFYRVGGLLLGVAGVIVALSR